jgi:hypothetical protein
MVVGVQSREEDTLEEVLLMNSNNVLLEGQRNFKTA